MPEEAGALDPPRETNRLSLPHFGSGPMQVSENGHPGQNVYSMQASKGEVDGEKRAAGRIEMVIEFRAVFKIFDGEKAEAAGHRQIVV